MSLVGQQRLNEGRRPEQREADADFVVLPFSEDSSSTLCAPKPKKSPTVPSVDSFLVPQRTCCFLFLG